MWIDAPVPEQLSGLRGLWKEAFGDTDTFLDLFFTAAFSPDRCRCVTLDHRPVSALYWFDCSVEGQKTAYIYAVATAESHRGQGLCRTLLADTHHHLSGLGYAGAILVPQEASLRQFYGALGYRDACGIGEFSCTAGEDPIVLRAIGSEEFALRRRRLLPPAGVIQEGENLVFLQNQLQFFTGDGFLLAAWEDKGVLHGVEFLGDREAAPGILRTLGCREGIFRCPGNEKNFAMYLPLTPDCICPGHFGFAFD